MASTFVVMRDRGAHFHKCDFQVHTPRDAAWSGEFSQATSAVERAAFARALVADARRKELDAIAITDHHDLCLWPFVREAATREIDQDGVEYHTDEPMAVFPGVELTLSSPPCQALLLFDPSLSAEALGQIWGALGLSPAPDSEPSCGDPTPLRRDLDLARIYTVLGSLAANPGESDQSRRLPLAGRFILLPHVHYSGHKTLLRRGQYKDYSEMPCVGGYIEGCFYRDLREGNRAIVEGRSIEWGNRAIGVFQTSDARKGTREGEHINFPELGNWPTWVKWTEPSAEALRQACLARDSRISHTEPTLPRLRILGVEVSNSAFLGPCTLWLNPQLNSFIGGRGTGKSSLLEYIRWGLCDDPLPSGATDASSELPDFQNRRKSLIEKTLRPAGAVVTIYYEKFGVAYRISRSSTDPIERVTVTSQDGTTAEMKGDQVRKTFPIIAYAQKQLSIVGTLPEEVRRLVTDPIREKLANIDRELAEVVLPNLKSARQRWLRLHQLNEHISEATQQLQSRKSQLLKLREGLKELSPEDATILNAHDAYRGESAWVEAVETSIESARSTLAQTAQVVNKKLSYHRVGTEWPHRSTIDRAATAIDELRDRVDAQLNNVLKMLGGLAALPEAIHSDVLALKADYEAHKEAYQASLERSTENAQQLHDVRLLEGEVGEIETRLTAYSDEVQTLTTIGQSDTADLWTQWVDLHERRASLLAEQADHLTAQADHAFLVTIQRAGNPAPVRSKLQMLVSCGRNIRNSDEKVRALTDHVLGSPDPLSGWVELIDELRTLIESREGASLPATPQLDGAGFSQANLSALRDGLESQLLEDARYIPLADDIVFQFTFGRDSAGQRKYIPFQDASPGQQATVLLKALLGQQGPPLFIDQPEEDLDNEQVNVIADHIRQTKHHRQIVFVSHNANLVVNGDSELVACFGYRTPGDQTSATVIQEGSIDFEPVRNIVTSVMEGGRAAFDLRRQKYNF